MCIAHVDTAITINFWYILQPECPHHSAPRCFLGGAKKKNPPKTNNPDSPLFMQLFLDDFSKRFGEQNFRHSVVIEFTQDNTRQYLKPFIATNGTRLALALMAPF